MATYNGHNEDSSGNILLSIGNGMTATVETGTTASQAYTKGSYLFFNNRLCKATSAISSGATLAIGTNLSQTSIGQEITSHLRSSDGKEFYFDVKDGTYGYYPSAEKTASEFVPFGGTAENFVFLHKTKDSTDIFYCDASDNKIYKLPLSTYTATIPSTQDLISGTLTYYSTSLTSLQSVHVTYMHITVGGALSMFGADYSSGQSLPNVSGNNGAEWAMLIWAI